MHHVVHNNTWYTQKKKKLLIGTYTVRLVVRPQTNVRIVFIFILLISPKRLLKCRPDRVIDTRHVRMHHKMYVCIINVLVRGRCLSPKQLLTPHVELWIGSSSLGASYLRRLSLLPPSHRPIYRSQKPRRCCARYTGKTMPRRTTISRNKSVNRLVLSRE